MGERTPAVAARTQVYMCAEGFLHRRLTTIIYICRGTFHAVFTIHDLLFSSALFVKLCSIRLEPGGRGNVAHILRYTHTYNLRISNRGVALSIYSVELHEDVIMFSLQ